MNLLIFVCLFVPLVRGYDSPKGSVYDFTVKDIEGNEVSLSKYRGKVLLIVNVASDCGLTERNYRELMVLQKELAIKGFQILGFPSNQFAGQEPKTNEEIRIWARDTYNVNFDMFSKISVNGPDADPLWRFLKERQGGIIFDGIKWNFTKFLVDRNGIPVARYSPSTHPFNIKDDIMKYIKKRPTAPPTPKEL